MKNLHIEHPEDSILTGDLSVLDWFTEPGHLSVKMDGCPAIVWGTDPANGRFFVGTKAVFNKVKIRIAHSHEEIDQFYEGNVAGILHDCFDYLPHTEGIFQGDFIGYGGNTEYTPNTITYRFPEVVFHKLIIAPHTCYFAESDLRDAIAYPIETHYQVFDDIHVKFVKPNAYILHHQESFADVEEVCNFARQMATLVNFVSEKEAVKIKKQINTCIREQREINAEEFECDRLLIEFWKLVKSIKLDCLYLCRNDGPATYLNGESVDAEGYVMSNQYGTYKLVNRSLFSHANFNNVKMWNK